MLASPFSCIVLEGARSVIAQDVVSNDVHVRFRSDPGWRTAEKLSEHSEVVASPVVDALGAALRLFSQKAHAEVQSSQLPLRTAGVGHVLVEHAPDAFRQRGLHDQSKSIPPLHVLCWFERCTNKLGAQGECDVCGKGDGKWAASRTAWRPWSGCALHALLC